MPEIELDHCVIHVSDWQRSNAFYRDVLGAELIPRRAGWVYCFGAVQLNLPFISAFDAYDAKNGDGSKKDK